MQMPLAYKPTNQLYYKFSLNTNIPFLGKSPPILRKTKNDPSPIAMIIPALQLTNGPIINSLDVNLRRGIKAKGN